MTGRDGAQHEVRVFGEIVAHGNFKDAARCLGLAPQTVKNHARKFYSRIGATNRLEAAEKLGWLNGPGCGRVK